MLNNATGATLSLNSWKIFFYMMATAIISGIIVSFIIKYFEPHHFGFNFDKTLSFASVSGFAGVIIAAPLLLFVFFPWFNSQKYKKNFLTWHIVPTLSALLYSNMISGDPLNPTSYTSILFFKLFGFTGLLTAFLMWLICKAVTKEQAHKSKNHSLIVEDANASN